ncbi:hypothetical protein A2U01_0079941, partial [Trifolium medium]|nr:hypothetical protein [Trifolium medium]
MKKFRVMVCEEEECLKKNLSSLILTRAGAARQLSAPGRDKTVPTALSEPLLAPGRRYPAP